MKPFKIIVIIFFCTISYTYSQDTDAPKKAIDAEQFEKAKSLLKKLIQSKPTNGEAFYLLGNIYLYQNILDSATTSFKNGLNAKDLSHYNNIGLGQIDLENGNIPSANLNFESALKVARKKDTQEMVYIGRGYMSSSKPDYKKAIEILSKAKAINYNDAQVNLALGDAYYGDKNQNESYASYRNAIAFDASLIRAKMQLGVLLKGAKAFDTAAKELNNLVNENPNYGPVYRELAETYYLWGSNDPSKRSEYTQKALAFYEKYMSLTDYSLNSRMRHADFLILTKDFVALEIEANKMKELDNVNPRILRYLGYSAYQNGNTDLAIKSLNQYISNPATKKIAKDYFYLGLSKLKKASNTEGKIIDQSVFDMGVADIKSSVDLDPKVADEINEIGSNLFKQKLFGPSATIFEIAAANKESKNYLMDNFYLGYSIYYGYDKTKPNLETLSKGELAFENVIEVAPKTQDAYFFKARINDLQEKNDLMAKAYQDYIDTVTAKGLEEIEKNKSKFIEAYNQIGSFYSMTDKLKAKEMWNKTLIIDPTNTYAIDSIKNLK